ncbi:RagB/SusD family nutrient uptake outer membrane protein [Solitalea koreensis]|uniref:SusD family protein n=1 Tax=Solitalea koreensis TaxID=543615 RepID=A0A521AW88_9SPHI|nr:RagB/SusD family nutrient uptake outer membrane protein [Solitalea koreensis]SMO38840.1 SusD family protein [Solitalea koreensis]
MKKIYRNIIVAICAVASLSSCTDYLDLKPDDKLLEDQVFSSAANTSAYLNGIYVKLGATQLYGENLTLTIPDLLAQQYNMNYGSTPNLYYTFTQYSYTSPQVSNKMAEIWANAYSVIFNANRFVAGLDRSPGVLTAKTDSTYRGEALAIRAMIHFDLLRLFGPMYNSADSTLKSIPYNTYGEITVNPFLPANEVMNHIMADLSKADSLLSPDKTMTSVKKYKFTYYSVKALQARVNLYRGNKAAALACAKALIDNSAKFPWADKYFLNERANPDRIFSSEMILGAYNPEMSNTSQGYLKLFSSGLSDNNILAPLDARLTALYSDASSDFRISGQFWDVGPSKSYRTFLKYSEVDDKTKSFRNTIPLLKLSEMYYIAAECEKDPIVARGYLNTVRNNRGIDTSSPVPATAAEILKEYRKEFLGEGQLWFYYKRTNTAILPNGSKGDDVTGAFTMGPAQYVVPIPTAETDNR